jgi:hypothetical protein
MWRKRRSRKKRRKRKSGGKNWKSKERKFEIKEGQKN